MIEALEALGAQPGWLVWGIGLALGFPAAAIALGQWASSARRRGNPTLARIVQLTANLLLPLLVAYLFLLKVVDYPSENLWVRTALTALLLAGLYLALGFVNAVIFGRADAGSSRARTPKLLRELLQALMVVIGGTIVLANVWDQDVGGLVTALGVGSIVLGLALQETLGNVMSGIALLMDRPFGEGDWVRFGLIEGKVEQINWRAVRIVDRAGDTIIVPHSIAGRDIVINNTLPRPTERNLIELGFSYRHPPNRVKAMLFEALSHTEGVLEDPPASVSTFAYAGETITYTAVFHVSDATKKFSVRDAHGLAHAQRHGISLALPVRQTMSVAADESGTRAAARALRSLESSMLLRGALDEDSIERIADAVALKRFAEGEAVLDQGAYGSALSLVVDGSAEMIRRVASGRQRTLQRLGRGDFFGEQALLSGLASPYAVVAAEDLVTLELDAATVDRLMKARPTLAADMGRVMDTRREAVAKAVGADAKRTARRQAESRAATRGLTLEKKAAG